MVICYAIAARLMHLQGDPVDDVVHENIAKINALLAKVGSSWKRVTDILWADGGLHLERIVPQLLHLLDTSSSGEGETRKASALLMLVLPIIATKANS